MMFYLQEQDLRKVIGGSEMMLLKEDANGILRKWRIKADKIIFSLKTIVQEELLEHIQDDKTLKETWDTFVILF